MASKTAFPSLGPRGRWRLGVGEATASSPEYRKAASDTESKMWKAIGAAANVAAKAHSAATQAMSELDSQLNAVVDDDTLAELTADPLCATAAAEPDAARQAQPVPGPSAAADAAAGVGGDSNDAWAEAALAEARQKLSPAAKPGGRQGSPAASKAVAHRSAPSLSMLPAMPKIPTSSWHV